MKKLIVFSVMLLAMLFAACEYDDSALWGEIDGVKQELADHERRIAALEELCKQMNTNISALQTAVTALQNNDFVTNVAPITKDGETIGYTVTFSKSGSITIYNGEDGEDGKDGADGEDVVAPVIGVKQDSDGVYYWTLDGEWLTDDAGNKIKAEGKDGKDGEDATDGEDGITPQLKIENDYWYVSYDNGATWKRLGKATGDSNTNVTDCNCIIKDVRQDDNNVYFELTDGTIITIPKSNGDNNSGDDGNDGDTSANLPPSNEIWYTSTDGNIVTPYDSNVFGANIVSNTYEDGKGVIKFDGDVIEIGEKAFLECSYLTTITIPDSVTEIRENAFYECSSLTTITIPNSVTKVGVAAFNRCSSLKAFYGKFASADNRCLIVDGTLNAFAIGCGATSYTIPDSVTVIGDVAFYECSSLTSVNIPDSVTTIGGYAFYGCSSLTSVTIPDSVTEIGWNAFENCSRLTSVTIGNSVTEIGVWAFSGCSSLKEFKGKFAADGGRCLIKDNTIIAYANASGTTYTIPDSVTVIGDRAFYDCSNLTNITIPDSVTKIDSRAFDGCSSLTSVTIPDSVTEIGYYAFSYCSSLTSVTIGNSVTEIRYQAFQGCSSLTSVTIGNSVTEIGEEAFSYCSSLTSVTIGDSVTTIGVYAFRYCRSLTNITIPNSVTYIGSYAFEDCSSLTSIYCESTIPPTCLIRNGQWAAFKSIGTSAKIYVPVGSGAAYKAAKYWSDYASMIEEKAM